jgi:hypothetical protein
MLWKIRGLSSGMITSFASAIAAILLCAATCNAAGLAKFENFNEGDVWFGPFDDPISGIHFFNPISANSNFVIEFGSASASRPLTSPGNYLSSNGHAPGDGISLPFQFGFSALLPQDSGLVQMEMIYVSSGGSVTLTGRNAAGQAVATTSFNGGGNFAETTLTLTSPSNSIHSFDVVASNYFDGFDNIRFSQVPEPATVGLTGVTAMVLMARRRRA